MTKQKTNEKHDENKESIMYKTRNTRKTLNKKWLHQTLIYKEREKVSQSVNEPETDNDGIRNHTANNENI